MNWQSLKIRYKLVLGFGIVLTITALSGAFLLTKLLAINKSSQSLYHKEIPALSKTYDLLNHWQQAIFYLRSFSSIKEKHYYIQARQHIKEAEIIIDSVKTGTEADEWTRISDELFQFKSQAKKSYAASLAVENAYAILDTAQQTLHQLSNKYLTLQYIKLKNDVDKSEAKHIIKRRADKIGLMNEIVNSAENLKIVIGMAEFKNDPSLLNDLEPSFDIIRKNVNAILPMTTKQYDIVSLNEILEQNDVCQSALKTLIANWNTYSQLNNHAFYERGLSLTSNLAKKQEEKLITSSFINLNNAMKARESWWWGLSLSLLTGIFLALGISRSLSGPLFELTHLAKLHSKGLLVSIPNMHRKDEIGLLSRSMRTQQEQARQMVKTLTRVGYSLNELMQRLNQKSEKLTESTTTQASSTEEITASIEEMQSLTQNSHNESQQAVSKLKNIQSDVDQYIAQNKSTIEHMQLLINRSKIISELAAQTYILSLNASIEASRNQGESNRGFAAIARSMRELSERVKAVTIELNELSAQGLTTSDEALNNLDNIKQIITNNTRVFQNMAGMSYQQNAEIAQISGAIQYLNVETQKSTRLAEELHTESAQLQHLGKELSKILSFYKSDKLDSSQTKSDKGKWLKIRFNKIKLTTTPKYKSISFSQ